MAESVFDELERGLGDPAFVLFFQQQCESWVAFYREQSAAIARINSQLERLIRPTTEEGIDSRERIGACIRGCSEILFGSPPNGRSATSLQAAMRTALNLEAVGRPKTPRQRMLVNLFKDIRDQECDLDGMTIYEALHPLESDPNYVLATKTDPDGSLVTIDRLRMDSRCLITALWVRRELGSTELLVSDPRKLSFDECPILATLTIADDHIRPKSERKRKRLNAIASSCLNAFREAHPPADTMTVDDLRSRTNEPGESTEDDSPAEIDVEYVASPTGQRDKWIYEKREAGSKNPEVIEELSKIFASRGWEHLTTTKSISSAVNRWVQRAGAKPLKPDKGGRPRKQNREAKTAK
ncbi:MAG: hypothetical protein AAGD07_21200 [Planctomycetota bacterium]